MLAINNEVTPGGNLISLIQFSQTEYDKRSGIKGNFNLLFKHAMHVTKACMTAYYGDVTANSSLFRST